MTAIARRWLKFNAVGAAGVAVQLAALAFYKSLLGIDYLAATALAVETAVLHNFSWHELWTWRGLTPGAARDIAGRILRFHLGNGIISIAANVLLMRLLAGALGIPYLAANLLSIGAASLANFAAGEWFVFRRPSGDL